MRLLLDVNVLLALGNAGHSSHAQVEQWFSRLSGATFLTCAITELGYVRVSTATTLQPSISAAITALENLKQSVGAEFVSDGVAAKVMPAWASTSSRTTDGHLAELAKAHGASLATMDRGIPGSLHVA